VGIGGLKWPGRKANHTSPNCPEDKNELSYVIYSPYMSTQRGHRQLHLPRLYLGPSGPFNSWGGVSRGPLVLRILAILLYGRRMTDEWKWCVGGMTVGMGKPKYSETILSQCNFVAFHSESPTFDPSVVHTGYAVDKVVLGHVSLSEYFGYPLSNVILSMLHIHVHSSKSTLYYPYNRSLHK